MFPQVQYIDRIIFRTDFATDFFSQVHVLEARHAKDVTEQTKDYTECLTLSRRLLLVGCIQHDRLLYVNQSSFSPAHPCLPPCSHTGLHTYFSEYVGCSLEISTGRDFRVGRPCQNLLEY